MLIGLNPSAPKAPAANAAIFDATTATFESAVVKASMDKPVLIDFWAPWCGPCKQLGPILEQAVTARGGKVALAKVDIDQNPDLAQAFRVQSIPMVVVLYQGQPITAFAGARPKADIDQLLDQLVDLQAKNGAGAPDISSALKDAAGLAAAYDYQGARQIYTAILQYDPDQADAFAGLVRTLIEMGELTDAQQLMAEAPAKIAASPVFPGLKTALELAAAAPADAVAPEAPTDLNDPAGLYEYAEACFSQGLKDHAVDALVELIRKHRSWDDEKARKQLLRYFEAWGFADPASVAGRRKLSAVLFS